MRTSVVSAALDSPVAEAAAAMVLEKVGSAFVMQGRFLAGILTEHDVVRAAASGTDLTKAPVSAWMTPDPESATPDTSVEDAARSCSCTGSVTSRSWRAVTCAAW